MITIEILFETENFAIVKFQSDNPELSFVTTDWMSAALTAHTRWRRHSTHEELILMSSEAPKKVVEVLRNHGRVIAMGSVYQKHGFNEFPSLVLCEGNLVCEPNVFRNLFDINREAFVVSP